jgi:hypothetical protein
MVLVVQHLGYSYAIMRSMGKYTSPYNANSKPNTFIKTRVKEGSL